MRQATPAQVQTPSSESGVGASKERICVDDFHLLLVIARLQCLSYGKTELTLNEWNKAKSLEKERKLRYIKILFLFFFKSNFL
jgi:hypothetical protein